MAVNHRSGIHAEWGPSFQGSQIQTPIFVVVRGFLQTEEFPQKAYAVVTLMTGNISQAKTVCMVLAERNRPQAENIAGSALVAPESRM
jgi:hypothetical protein